MRFKEEKLVNLNEIAELAGVNVSTVSRALKDSPSISSDTKEKIMQIAQENGYVVKERQTRHKTIGVIIPETVSHYYAKLAARLENKIYSEQYHMIISITDFDLTKLMQAMNMMIKYGVEGIVVDLSASRGDRRDAIQAIAKCEIPLVIVSERDVACDRDCVYLDYQPGVASVIQHLAELGHRKISYVGDELSHTRCEAFRHSCDEIGCEVGEIMEGPERFEKGGYVQMKRLLAIDHAPRAILASYDQVAIGAIKALHEAGLHVPEDVSIVGFDNIDIDDYLLCPLTSVTNPVDKIAEIAVKILLNKIDHPDDMTVQHVALQPHLVVRETTGVNKRHGK